MEKYIEKLKKLNKKALKNNDVPVSAIIIKNNKVIAKAYNKRNKNKNPLYHAEILAIEKASKKSKTYNLIECEMTTTLKPCKMCEEVIKSSKIKKVYYLLDQKKNVNNKIDYQKLSDENDYFKLELSNFFADKR